MNTSPLFEKLVEACGLSSLFARRAMERACQRAGITPSSLRANDLPRLLVEVEVAIKPFLGEAELLAALERVRALSRW